MEEVRGVVELFAEGDELVVEQGAVFLKNGGLVELGVHGHEEALDLVVLLGFGGRFDAAEGFGEGHEGHGADVGAEGETEVEEVVATA